VYRNFLLANEYQSSKLCEARFSECEDKMDHLQVLKLPSMAKFNAGFTHCNQSFVKDCVGPAKESYERRMSKVCLLILNIVFMSVIKECKGEIMIFECSICMFGCYAYVLQPSSPRQTSLILYLLLVAVILHFISCVYNSA
jgi:hypothetical protein